MNVASDLEMVKEGSAQPASVAARLSFPAEDLEATDDRVKKIEREFKWSSLPIIGRFFGKGYTAIR
jgi:hypothetical protein